MALTELLDNVPVLENGMVPVYKDWERTAIPLRKYFHDISVFLWTKRIEHLFHMGPGVNIMKDKKWLKFYVDLEMLDKRYALYNDPSWKLLQWRQFVRLPKPETTQAPKEVIWEKRNNQEDLEERVAILEKIVMKFMSNDK